MAAYTAIDDPEAYFQAKLYTGNNTDGLAITFDGDEDMSPDLIWIKCRSNAHGSNIADTVRGISNGGTKILVSDSTQTEETNDSAKGIKTADSNGFTLGAETNTSGSVNGSSKTYVAWCWKESATAGFDIVSFTGNGSARTISHSLSAVPNMIIVKNRDEAENWCVYHTSIANTKALILNTTTAELTDSKFWNDTSATSSVFTVGNGTEVNGSSDNMIAYLWRSVQGFSKVGKFTGNGNINGPFVHTGFRPAFVMCKRTDSTGSWYMCDNKRLGYNGLPNNSATVGNVELTAHDPRTEAGGNTNVMNILSNGFKLIQSGAEINASGGTFIYMAYAEQPFANSNGVPATAR